MVHYKQLDNGIRLIVKQMSGLMSVTMGIIVGTGACIETDEEDGISHFIEHMMFKGTRKFPEGSLSKTVARLGGRDNAFTNTDYTAYFQQIPKDHLEKMMEMEADRMRNLQFKASDFDKEIRVARGAPEKSEQ